MTQETTFMNSISRRGVVVFLVWLVGASSAWAQDAFPERPVRIIVNTAPGGLVDVTTRLVAEKMRDTLKQPVIVENRAGGDGLIAIRAVKAAPADGYTLVASAGTIAMQMAIKLDPGYDLTKDFTGIGLMGRSPFLLVVEPHQPYKTVADFVAVGKADPSKVSYASAGVGTMTHMAAEVFLQKAGLSNKTILHVPYKGNGAAMPDVMSGRVTAIFEAYGSSSGKIKAGQLRALGVTSAARIAALPDVPTFAEQGVPDYTFHTWMSLLAPAGTPGAIVQRLSEALHAATASVAIRDRYRDDGIEVIYIPPGEFNQFLVREVAQFAKLASDLALPKQ
jgi:tripartite-type tricarboxylate transporter receptor subunit TctC